MAKKIQKRKAFSKNRSKDTKIIFQYISIGLAAIILTIAGKAFINGITTVHVLGASTGPVLLADHGSDNSTSEGGGDSPSSGGSISGGSVSGESGGSGSLGGSVSIPGDQTVTGGTNTSLSGSTQVDCVGPDGKHFTTEYHDCQELNQKWGRSNFNFTPLPTQKGSDTNGGTSREGEQPKPTGVPSELEAQVESNHSHFNLEQAGLHVEFEVQGGHMSAKAKSEDGKEVELDSKDTLDQINSSLEDQGIEIKGSSGSAIEVQKNDVKALTEFPLSIDPTTHELTITTPSGVKTVTVLPDQAVANALKAKVLTDVTTEGSTDSAVVTTNTTLTELNNEAVFEISGVAEKKLLGLFPVGFAKTTFVSATTGDIVQTNESPLNKLLESISF